MFSSLDRIGDRRLIAAAMAAVGVAFLAPIATGVVLSFSGGGRPDFTAFDGYIIVFSGGRPREFGIVIGRAFVSALIATLLAVPGAFWLGRIRFVFWRTAAFALLVTPWFVSDMLRAFGWQLILAPDGAVSRLWDAVTGRGALEGLRYNFGAAVLGICSSVLPVGILSVFAALPAASRDEWLAAAEIGRRGHTFRLFAIQRARPGIILGFGAMFILACYASAEPRYLDGPTQTSISTIAASLINDGVPALLAYCTLLIAFMGATVALVAAMLRGVRSFRGKEGTVVSDPVLAPVPRSGVALRTALAHRMAQWMPSVCGVGSIALCCLPTVFVMAEAFWQPDASGGHWTLDHFFRLAEARAPLAALGNSALLAIVISPFICFLALTLSLAVFRSSGLRWVALLLMLVFIAPGDAYALSLVQMLKLLGDVEGGWSLLAVSHVLWALPIATGSLILAQRQLRPEILQAGLELSRGPMDTIRHVLVPLNRTRLVGVVLIACTLSLNEGVRTAYLSGGVITIGNEVHGRLAAGLLPENRVIFAIEFIIFCLAVGTILLLARIRGLDPTAED